MICALVLTASAGAQTLTGLQPDVVFNSYSQEAEPHELMRRVLTPLTDKQSETSLALMGKSLPAQSVDLANEHFVVYVPPNPPPMAGYGLFVFVMPWNHARLPYGWADALDNHNMIFVAAAMSGNDQSVIDRREPLALLAKTNIAERYHVDSSRIYIGGLSGGARVALRLALAYPDVFSGAFLNAGSDPLGTVNLPIPSPDLFGKFQENSRIYYATGAHDVGTLALDSQSMRSMRAYCAFNFFQQIVPDTTHEMASGRVFAAGLDFIDKLPAQNDTAQFSSCRAALASDMGQQLDMVRSDIAAGKQDDARKILIDVNSRYGGLAMPAILDLAGTLKLSSP